MADTLVIRDIEFRSRLWVGTGKYRSFDETVKAIEASGADVVTVAVRRVNITDRKSENFLDRLDLSRIKVLPNTAGCYTVEDALRYSRLARELYTGKQVETVTLVRKAYYRALLAHAAVDLMHSSKVHKTRSYRVRLLEEFCFDDRLQT